MAESRKRIFALRRCLIANRGEVALRIIRACHELDMEAVAVYSPADAQAAHVSQADAAYPLPGNEAAASYLNSERLLAIAREAKCECLHPGYGFLSESAAFARAVTAAGIAWVGPGADAMAVMGDKRRALAALAGGAVPTLPHYAPQGDLLKGPMSGTAEAEFRRQAARIGYPLLVKAAGGGGGRGIRIARNEAELAAGLASAQREAERAFGDGRVYLEKYLDKARHIEVQIAADRHGAYRHFWERECSLQRRRQKIIEEAPAPDLPTAQRRALCEAALAVARAVDYENIGTVEFLLAADGQFYFLEMNTRLQVEHPVTEWVCGVDLVKLQFRLADGAALCWRQEEIQARGHAIQCRVYAEAPERDFLPASGIIQDWRAPAGVGIRCDSALQAGDEVGAHYDTLLAKLIAWDETRAAALVRLRLALRQTIIPGVESNLNFLSALLDLPEVAAGKFDTGLVQRKLPELLALADEELPLPALLAAMLAEKRGAAASPALAPRHDDPWARADRFRLGGGKSGR